MVCEEIYFEIPDGGCDNLCNRPQPVGGYFFYLLPGRHDTVNRVMVLAHLTQRHHLLQDVFFPVSVWHASHSPSSTGS